MAWMAVPFKIILCFFSVLFVGLVIFQLPLISKISNQLIYSLSSGLFFLQSNIAYVGLFRIFRLRDGYMS